MTLSRIALVICLAGLLISLMVSVFLIVAYLRWEFLLYIFLDTTILMKLGAVLLVLLAVISSALAAKHLRQKRKNGGLAQGLRLIAAISVGLGFLCALNGWFLMKTSLWDTNEVTFSMQTTDWAQIALMLVLGFLPAVIALLGAAPLRVGRRR